MRNYFVILERELKAYFVSPMAYVVLGFFVLITGLFFYNIMTWFDRMSMMATMQAQQYRQAVPVMNVNVQAIRPLMQNLSTISLFLLPALTMRLFAEEKRQGTMEFLLTSPITNLQITLAKFTSATIFYFAMIAVTSIFISFLFLYGDPELTPILTGYVGLLLVGACFIASGLLFSALTENQIIAYIGSLAFNLVVMTLGWFSSFATQTFAIFLKRISPLEHFDDFSKGVIDSEHFVFYLSFIAGWLFLTYIVLESSRWRGVQTRRIQLCLPVTVAEFAKALGKAIDRVLEKGRDYGLTSQEQSLTDKAVVIEVALEFGCDAEVIAK